MVVISACSWPPQRSCFFREFHPPLMIVRVCWQIRRSDRLVLIGSLALPPLVLLISLSRRLKERKIAAFPTILVALLICCSAHNTAHVGDDLYPVSSNSSVRLVSFRMVVISACSWPFQRSSLFSLGKFHLPIVIVHPCPGCPGMYLDLPS